MDEPESALPVEQRKRRILRKVLGLVGLLFVLLAVCICLWQQPKAQVDNVETRLTGPIDKDGMIDYLAAMDKGLADGVTMENNAAVILIRVFGEDNVSKAAWKQFAPTTQDSRERTTTWRDFLKRVTTTRPDLANLADGKSDPCREATTRPWRDKEFPVVAEWIRINQPALGLIRQAAARSRYYWPADVPTERPRLINFLPKPTLDQQMQIGTLLAACAMQRAGRGDIDGAAEDIGAIFRLACFVGRGDNKLITQMIGVLIQSIAAEATTALVISGKMSLPLRRRLIDQIANMPAVCDVLGSIDREARFMHLDAIQTFDKTGYKDPTTGKPVEWVRDAHVDWNAMMRDANRYYDSLVAAVRQPTFAKQVAEIDKVQAELPGSKEPDLLDRTNLTRAIGNLLLAILAPDAKRCKLQENNCATKQQLALLALALSAYKTTHGAYPDSLEKLAPEFLGRIPKDPFTGGPLGYRRVGEGYLLYGFGANMKDDGGENNERDYTQYPKTDDIAIRADR